MALQAETDSNYDRESELKAFDDTKAGVKGLVDARVAKVPRIFKCEQSVVNLNSGNSSQLRVLTIDPEGIHKDPNTRTEIINKVKNASEEWGFFQVISHGIPLSVLNDIKDGIRRFHELDTETKKKLYSRDPTQRVFYNSNFDLYQAPLAGWRDTILCHLSPHPPSPVELPDVCRDAVMEYRTHVLRLGHTMFELLSEALGLNSSHLNDMDYEAGLLLLGHYYPACPEPEFTLGTTQHTDGSFITILLQDLVGGLQVLHENQWIDVRPTDGALIINIGDFLQESSVYEVKFTYINLKIMKFSEIVYFEIQRYIYCQCLSKEKQREI
ncbi:1-aminocyclopropane-1-carboxylate oxidase homolog 1 [Citrus clementina]|uniref:1-aminocyclopropane-1-carboxylate oxidase homolog 1 n=1 Tax=Citrus clementina TaxID=85681 RepID=UPI000CECF8FE|nr:1-aminocyclopropane-1-carboxylate oxidase homolog 1 [Citrus x clementina]